MVKTQNETIEWKGNKDAFSIDSLSNDLAVIEHEVELENELQLFSDTAEVEAMMEKSQFFTDAFSIETKFDSAFENVAENEYDTFEFSVGRFIVLPILVKSMMQTKSITTWKISINDYKNNASSLRLDNPIALQQHYTSMGLPSSKNVSKLFSMMKVNKPFVQWRVNKRLQQSIIDPIKEASVSYAEQYNTIKGKEEKNNFDGWSLSDFWQIVKNDWWGIEWVQSAWEQTDNKTQTILTWLWVWLFLTWAYTLRQTFTPKRRKGFTKVSWFFWDMGKWTLLWATGWLLAMYIAKKLEKFELTFEDALKAVPMEIETSISEWDIKKWMWDVSYDPQIWAIKSYKTYVTPINKKTKQIPWLNIKFTKHKSTIHAANLINFVKFKYKWQWKKKKPFYPDPDTWDIYIQRRDWSKEIVSWGRWSTLSQICPEINSSHNSRILMCNYLNEIQEPKWFQWNQNHFDPPKNTIERSINSSLDLLEKTQEDTQYWNARLIDYETKESPTKDICTIKSRDGETTFTIEKDKNWTPTEISFPWCDTFVLTTDSSQYYKHSSPEEMIVEWILIANFTNFLVKNFQNWCKKIHPYSFGDWHTAFWIYVKEENSFIDTQVLRKSPSSLKKFPTLLASLADNYLNWKKEFPYIDYLNEKTNANWTSLRM